MPTTRSAGKQMSKATKQTTIEESTAPSKAKSSKKRKTVPDAKEEKSTSPKKVKAEADDISGQEIIMINRSPVLQLWGAEVSHFLHPDLAWKTCLAIGASISTLCAISKGRSIGVIEPKDESDRSDRKKKQTDKDARRVVVMGFPMQIKGDDLIVDGKPKPFNEANLTPKFGGDEQYAHAKKVFDESLQNWKGSEEELGKKAFHMYEQFRPSVAGGQHGWGRKGKLNLDEVRKVIRES